MKPFILLGSTLLFLTVIDILMVETVFSPLEAWSLIGFWHLTYFIIISATLLLLYHTTKKSWYLVGGVLFFMFGLEDTLFYALQGEQPEVYTGVSVLGVWEPSRTTVYLINLAGVLLIYLLWRRHRAG